MTMFVDATKTGNCGMYYELPCNPLQMEAMLNSTYVCNYKIHLKQFTQEL